MERDKPVLEPETVQLFRHTIRASLIFYAEGQSLLVQLQCSGDVAVLCLRSDLVVLQDAALQTYGCISLGWHLLERGCTPSLQCVYGPDFSLCCVKYVVLALVGKSRVRVVKSAKYIFVIFGRVRFLAEHFSRAS